MINIYEKNETTFTNNGLATLEPMTCDLSMTINGAWVLSVEHPYDQEGKWTELQKGRIIQVTGINVLRNCSTSQRYRIYDTTKTLTSINVIAFPVGMEATYDAVIEELKKKKRTGNQAVSDLSSYLTSAGVTKYTLTASGLSKQRSFEFKNTNLIAALCGDDDNSIVNKYNAEVAYNNYQIFVKKNIGSTTDYDVRIGKNLTGLSYELDDSEVVTRLYPISQDGIRYNDYGSVVNPHYVQSEDWEEYPHIRAAFVEAPYSLIDTDIEAEVQTDTIEATSDAYDSIYNDIYAAMSTFWVDVYTDNEFVYTGTLSETLPAVPEFIQHIIKDISTNIAETILSSISHAGLKSWFVTAIKNGMDWIYDVDLPEKNWIQNQDNSYSYGTTLRVLTSEWAKIDGKMSYFNSSSKWVPEKDDPIPWDWVQKKGQSKKYGNNKRYNARDTYIYNRNDYSGGANDGMYKYWFDEDGWWDGDEEETSWQWNQSGSNWWFGDPDAGQDSSKYAHDCWLFIRETSGSAAKLYYFGSDGFMKDEESVSWDWHKEKDKWYFGSTDKNSRAIYLSSQWLYIDGEWWYFDSNGYAISPETMMANTMGVLLLYLSDAAISDVDSCQDTLYALLFNLMQEYCEDLYADGLDDPLINVSIDFVDLSKTQEYASFSALETICLGDSVKVTYDTSGSYVEEEVVGLVYDCLKGCNTQITVGRASKTVSQMFDTSVKGPDSGQRLVAGENVTITGNTINVSSQVGDVYAGDTVSVQQLQSTGNAIARISVNGIRTTIYAVGNDVQVTPIKQSGDKIATITVGGTAYDIYADTGLKYWVETQTDIYREGTREGLKADSGYYVTNASWGSPRYHYRKTNNQPAVAGNFNGGTEVILIAPYTSDHKAVEWEYEYYWGDELGWIHYGNSLWDRIAGYGAPRNYASEGTWQAVRYFDFTYKQEHWCGSYMIMGEGQNGYFDFESFTYSGIDDYTAFSSIVSAAKKLIDTAHASQTVVDIMGISNQDHILYYNDDKEGNYDTANRDDAVYISKDGIFNGKEFRINGQTVGGFYKTRLYLGTEYSSTIGLTDSYTSYDMLMIETYNADDKKNLASIVNVSDLVNASYVGVEGYLMYTITNGRTLTFHEAPSDTNHSRYIKAVYGLRTSHDEGTESPIDDVIVDGVSVVSGGVATIGVGSNLAFNNGVLSATNTTYNDFAGSSHGLVPAVQTQSGKYLKDDGTWDEPEGTTVEANPSGTATATLSTIQIEDTIYEVVGSGGGGSRTLLYSGSTTTGTITLSDSYENYDYLYVVAYAVGEITALVDTDRLGYDISAFTLSECSGSSSASQSNADMYVELVVTNSTTLTIANPIGGIVVKKIYGINGLGGGGIGHVQALSYKQLTPTQYENLSLAEKNNGTIYFVSENSTGEQGLSVITISASDYANLSQAEKNNGIPYFVY